jgi:hypothetical protein
MNNFVSINEDLPVSIYQNLYNFKNNNDFIDEKFSLDRLCELAREYYTNENRLETDNVIPLRNSKTIVSSRLIRS